VATTAACPPLTSDDDPDPHGDIGSNCVGDADCRSGTYCSVATAECALFQRTGQLCSVDRGPRCAPALNICKPLQTNILVSVCVATALLNCDECAHIPLIVPTLASV
jgi:hypothetical protein